MKKFALKLAIVGGFFLCLCVFLFSSSIQTLDLASSAPTEPTTRAIIQKVKNGDLRPESVEDFIQLLPEYMRSNHVFSYASRSLQESSFEFPRAIMFSHNIKEMVTFNGQPAQRGGDRVEAIILDDTSNRYEFFEISFADKKAHVEENPAKCFSCHATNGKDPLPIWEPYPLWTGFYGSEDDCISHDPEDGLQFPGPCLDDSTEMRWYKKFMEGNRLKGRYALLPEQTYMPGDTKGTHRPMLFLSRELMHQNSDRIAKNMVRNGLASVRHLILYSLRCSPSECPEVFPEEMRSAFVDFAERTNQALADDQVLGLEHRYRQMRYLMNGKPQSTRVKQAWGSKGPEDHTVFETEKGKKAYRDNSSLVIMRQMGTFYPLMRLLGQHPERWSMTPAPRYFAWDIGMFLTDEMMSSVLEELFPEHWNDHEDELFEKAKAEARTALPHLLRSLRQESSRMEDPWAREVRLARETFNRTCTRCHAEGALLAPKIDFTKPELLLTNQAMAEKVLNRIQSEDPEYKMPADEILTPTVKNALVRYIQAISGVTPSSLPVVGLPRERNVNRESNPKKQKANPRRY